MLNQHFYSFFIYKSNNFAKNLYLNQWNQQNYLDGYLKI